MQGRQKAPNYGRLGGRPSFGFAPLRLPVPSGRRWRRQGRQPGQMRRLSLRCPCFLHPRAASILNRWALEVTLFLKGW